MHASAPVAHGFTIPASRRSPALPRLRPLTFHAAESEIYAQAERAGTIYRIEYGAVRIYRMLADGRRQIVAFHISGETFGFEAGASRNFFAEAVVQTGLTTVDVGSDGCYSAELLALALEGMVRAQEHLLVVGKQSALEKLSVFLVDLADRQGGLEVIDLPMSRTDIGDYLGMTIETVSRSVTKLRCLGILKLKNSRSIEILQPEKLRQLSKWY